MGLAKFMNESDVSELGLIQPRGCLGTREVVSACILCGVFFCADLPLSATVYLNKGQIPGKMPTKVCRMSWKSINVLKESIGQKHIGKEALEVSGGAQSPQTDLDALVFSNRLLVMRLPVARRCVCSEAHG